MGLDFEVARTVKLSKPIHYAGETLTELQFREAEAELLDIVERCRNDKKPRGESLVIMSWFTGVGVASLKRLKWSDTQLVMEAIGELMAVEFDDDEDAEPGE